MESIENSKNDSDINEIKEKYQTREKEISALLSATETILKSEEFTITAKKVFDSCAKVIGAKSGYVALLSDDGHENELLFLEDGGMPCNVNPELPMPIRGLRETAYRTGKVVYDNDFMNSEWVKFMPKGHMRLRNVLFSPLNIDSKTVGIMGFACKDGDFTENDAKLAAAFGNYAAIALQNSKILDELISSNKTKDKFFSIIAHDLRAPFNSLIGFSNLLMELVSGTIDKDVQKYSSIINEGLNKTYTYLNNLLEWSRLQTNKIEFRPTNFNVFDLTIEVKELLSLQAQNKEININISIPKQMQLYADINMIKVILINLISNAIKYSNLGNNITVSGKRINKRDKIFVEDNGVGMSQDSCHKLFKVEESFSTPGTNNEKGTGLGLVLCNEFIKKHNGQIEVKSEIGKGSVFWISLPCSYGE
ncbi:MAG: GAF domain-containing sensor histidine kinase [Ignavibacteria bacterium]|nr:GAF domain-containing sensor histidine kinase [Ignavibacteria bacterium]